MSAQRKVLAYERLEMHWVGLSVSVRLLELSAHWRCPPSGGVRPLGMPIRVGGGGGGGSRPYILK